MPQFIADDYIFEINFMFFNIEHFIVIFQALKQQSEIN